mgnify:CR=1 FL=1
MKKYDGGFRENVHVGGNYDGVESKHIANYESTAEILHRLELELQDVFDREMVLIGAESRKLNVPETETGEGSVRGAWNGSVFVLDDNYVPEKYNDSNSSIAQIKKNCQIDLEYRWKGYLMLMVLLILVVFQLPILPHQIL